MPPGSNRFVNFVVDEVLLKGSDKGRLTWLLAKSSQNGSTRVTILHDK